MNEKEFIEALLKYMAIEDFTVELSDKDGVLEILIQVKEEDSGMLIGRRGETIRAIQRILYLTFRESLLEKQLFVDVNEYRQRRYSSIEQMAQEATEEVLSTNSPVTLPRMSADERRKVHMFLAGQDQVETRSYGEGESRRLSIFPKGYDFSQEEIDEVVDQNNGEVPESAIGQDYEEVHE